MPPPLPFWEDSWTFFFFSIGLCLAQVTQSWQELGSELQYPMGLGQVTLGLWISFASHVKSLQEYYRFQRSQWDTMGQGRFALL